MASASAYYWNTGPPALNQLKAGATVKASIQDGEPWLRAEVLEVEPAGDGSVKVRWWGKGKEDDCWLALPRCRLIRQIAVDWMDVEKKLPIGQDPDSRALRKAVFDSWDGRQRKALSLEELQMGVAKLLGSEFGEDVEETSLAVRCAWKAARNLAPSKKKRKASAKLVDFKEFHAFIVALRYYLELSELFEHLDGNYEEDQRLSLRECRKGELYLRGWGIHEAELEERFRGQEPWRPVLKFEDFAKWCVESRFTAMKLERELDTSDDEVQEAYARAGVFQASGISGEERAEGLELHENRKRVTELFGSWDSDHNGTITEDELVSLLSELNPDIEPASARKLFAEADSNKNGQVDYEEFCHWLFR